MEGTAERQDGRTPQDQMDSCEMLRGESRLGRARSESLGSYGVRS